MTRPFSLTSMLATLDEEVVDATFPLIAQQRAFSEGAANTIIRQHTAALQGQKDMAAQPAATAAHHVGRHVTGGDDDVAALDGLNELVTAAVKSPPQELAALLGRIRVNGREGRSVRKASARLLEPLAGVVANAIMNALSGKEGAISLADAITVNCEYCRSASNILPVDSWGATLHEPQTVIVESCVRRLAFHCAGSETVQPTAVNQHCGVLAAGRRSDWALQYLCQLTKDHFAPWCRGLVDADCADCARSLSLAWCKACQTVLLDFFRVTLGAGASSVSVVEAILKFVPTYESVLMQDARLSECRCFSGVGADMNDDDIALVPCALWLREDWLVKGWIQHDASYIKAEVADTLSCEQLFFSSPNTLGPKDAYWRVKAMEKHVMGSSNGIISKRPSYSTPLARRAVRCVDVVLHRFDTVLRVPSVACQVAHDVIGPVASRLSALAEEAIGEYSVGQPEGIPQRLCTLHCVSQSLAVSVSGWHDTLVGPFLASQQPHDSIASIDAHASQLAVVADCAMRTLITFVATRVCDMWGTKEADALVRSVEELLNKTSFTMLFEAVAMKVRTQLAAINEQSAAQLEAATLDGMGAHALARLVLWHP